MKSAVSKRSVIIGGHKTSVSLEQAFWEEVRAIAEARRVTVSHVLRDIDRDRDTANLSSAIRVHVLRHVRAQADAARHQPPAISWPADLRAG